MLSMSRDEAKSDIQRAAKVEYKIRYWIPRLDSTHPVPGFYAFVDEASYMFEEHGLWQEGIPPNYTLINASNPVWAHARRRASEEAAAVKRMEAARARGETCPRGIHETDMHALRAERHQRRMQSGGNWREEEQRRLAETVVVEGGTDIVTEAPCPHCVTWSGEVEFQLLQKFRYYDFPFDRHVIRIEYVVAGADLYTCKGRDGLAIMGLTAENALDKLLPTTGTWFLDGEFNEAVTLHHPVNILTGQPKREFCIVEIAIKRNWIIYFVKQICTMLLCTAAGLMALLMQPGDLLGDRVGLILIAILIVITTLQNDIGLGNLSYLIWVDFFNLMQLMVLLIALGQTMIIHRLDHGKKSDLLVFFDKVSRVVIPCLLYPASVVGMILLGLQDYTPGFIVLISGYGGSLLVTLIWVKQVYFQAMIDRNQAIHDVHNATGDMMKDPKIHMGLMKRLFGVFDVDHGGEIDGKEMRALMINMHPHVPRGAISLGMLEVARYSDAGGSLDLPSFVDAFEAAERVISLYVEDAIADGAVSERSAKIMRRNLTMTSVKGDGKGAKKLGGSQADALSQALATLEADDMDPNAEADPLAA